MIDEAWKAFRNPYFAEVIEGWLATLRKQNAVVVILSQNAQQLSGTKLGDRIFSFFPTQIIFPDPKSTEGDYSGLRLNSNEAGLVTERGNGRYFLLRDDQGSVMLDADASALGPLLNVLGGGSSGIAAVGEDFRERPGFWRKLVENFGNEEDR